MQFLTNRAHTLYNSQKKNLCALKYIHFRSIFWCFDPRVESILADELRQCSSWVPADMSVRQTIVKRTGSGWKSALWHKEWSRLRICVCLCVCVKVDCYCTWGGRICWLVHIDVWVLHNTNPFCYSRMCLQCEGEKRNKCRLFCVIVCVLLPIAFLSAFSVLSKVAVNGLFDINSNPAQRQRKSALLYLQKTIYLNKLFVSRLWSVSVEWTSIFFIYSCLQKKKIVLYLHT